MVDSRYGWQIWRPSRIPQGWVTGRGESRLQTGRQTIGAPSDNLPNWPIYVGVMLLQPQVTKDQRGVGWWNYTKLNLLRMITRQNQCDGGVWCVTEARNLPLRALALSGVSSGPNGNQNWVANWWSMILSSAPESINARKGSDRVWWHKVAGTAGLLQSKQGDCVFIVELQWCWCLGFPLQ